MIRALILSLSAFVLASCQTVGSQVGSGPLNLSGKVVVGLERYLAHDNALAFAVTSDGRTYGFGVCNAHSCREDLNEIAFRSCERRARGKRCSLFASGRDIVWNGPITYTPHWLNGAGPNDRSVVLYWGHRTQTWYGRKRASGVARFDTARRRARLDFLYHKKLGSCVGELAIGDGRNGQFAIDCSKTGKAASSFRITDPYQFGGDGMAERGDNIVELLVLPRTKYLTTRIRARRE